MHTFLFLECFLPVSALCLVIETLQDRMLILGQHREIVGQFYCDHKEEGKAFTVAHFGKLGLSRATVYRITDHQETQKTTGRKKGVTDQR